MVMLPGVPVAPPTVNHVTDETAENASAWELELELTEKLAGDGAADVPAMIANDVLAAERTRAVAAG